MNLEEALKYIKELEEKTKKLEAELYNERKEKEKLLLALIHQKEKKNIAYVRQFVPKTEKTNKVVINLVLQNDAVVNFVRFVGYHKARLLLESFVALAKPKQNVRIE